MAGYPHDDQLRARIQAFSPDEPGVVFPFSTRLAHENGWSRAFARRVMDEYRRFRKPRLPDGGWPRQASLERS
jgi:hypothetical protein